MSYDFRLPDLGEGLASAEVVEWHVQVGDTVAVDQALVSVETDKLQADLPSPVAGEVMTLGVQEGETVEIGAVLLTIAAEAPADAAAPAEATAPAGPPGGPAVATTDPPPGMAPARGPASGARRAKAAPAVRRLAVEQGVDLETVPGTGPGGRVTREDVIAAAAAGARPPAVASPGAREERIPLRGLRRQIARNMVESWTRIPLAVDFREIDATRLMETRRVAAAWAPPEAPLTFLGLMIKIAAVALRDHRMFNARLDEEAGEIVIATEINVGVATATPDGVIVPVLRRADERSVYEIAREVAGLAARARDRTLTAEELAGGTFTVNNTGALGPIGGAFPTPLINWPEVAILAFGRIADRVVAVDGQAVVRPTMMLTVTADHRLVDGAALVDFTNDVVEMILAPDRRLGTLAP